MIPQQPVSTHHLSRDVAQSYLKCRSELVQLHNSARELSRAAFSSAQSAREIKASTVSLQRQGYNHVVNSAGVPLATTRLAVAAIKEVKDGLKSVGNRAERIVNDADFMANHQDRLMQDGSRTTRFVPYPDKMRFCENEKNRIATNLLRLTSSINQPELAEYIGLMNELRPTHNSPYIQSIDTAVNNARATAQRAAYS